MTSNIRLDFGGDPGTLKDFLPLQDRGNYCKNVGFRSPNDYTCNTPRILRDLMHKRFIRHLTQSFERFAASN